LLHSKISIWIKELGTFVDVKKLRRSANKLHLEFPNIKVFARV
jgi:hypothetical protein